MNVFDSSLLSFFNQFSRLSPAFDASVAFLAGSHLLKGGLLMMLLWAAWFKDEPGQALVRRRIVATLTASAVALFLARVLAAALPFRLRPLYHPDVEFVRPAGLEAVGLGSWSSFPSDHAVLFATLSIGLLFAWRPAGVFACLYTAVCILTPRVYLGFHYPTDIVVGAAIGAMVAWIFVVRLVDGRFVRRLEAISAERPAVFYTALFLATYQIATMFDGTRALAKHLWGML
jgi:undecaprenyl-diphosphatase